MKIIIKTFWLISLIQLLFTDSINSQDIKNEIYFKGQIGLFSNFENIRGNNIFDNLGFGQPAYSFNQTSFRRMSYGILKLNSKNLTEFNFEISEFSNIYIGPQDDPVQKRKILIELEYFRSLRFIELKKMKLIPGFITSLSYDRKLFEPELFTYPNLIETCFCLNFGVKSNFSFVITKNFSGYISSKLNLIGIGYFQFESRNQQQIVNDQVEKEINLNFIDSRLLLDFGFIYNISDVFHK